MVQVAFEADPKEDSFLLLVCSRKESEVVRIERLSAASQYGINKVLVPKLVPEAA
jgi:hypothetical protein